MAVSNTFTTWTFVAKNDLSSTERGTGALYKAINGQTGDIAGDGFNATGILYTPVESGNHDGTYADDGKMKYTAAIAISSQNLPLTITTSGYVTVASDGDWAVGKSIGDAVASGAIGIGKFDFGQASYIASGGAIY